MTTNFLSHFRDLRHTAHFIDGILANLVIRGHKQSQLITFVHKRVPVDTETVRNRRTRAGTMPARSVLSICSSGRKAHFQSAHIAVSAKRGTADDKSDTNTFWPPRLRISICYIHKNNFDSVSEEIQVSVRWDLIMRAAAETTKRVRRGGLHLRRLASHQMYQMCDRTRCAKFCTRISG